MRKAIVAIVIIGGLIGMALFAQAKRAAAIQTFVAGVKSDCASVEAQVTLLYSNDDLPDNPEDRDYFKLIIMDQTTGNFLAQIPESITDEQTPWYWVTNRVETAPFDGVYNIEMWDVDQEGNLQTRVESIIYDCKDRSFTVDVGEHGVITEVPEYTCQTSVPVYTTNLAPEDGTVVVTWSFDGPENEDQDWHVETRRVFAGQGYDMELFPIPCYAWVKLYYQPDSTKLIYLMPSQYWPHDAFGAGADDGDLDKNIYHTFFPLDGPIKEEELPPVLDEGTSIP